MAANTAPIYTRVPNIGSANITTTYAQTKSNGTSAASGNDFMVNAFIAGADGSYVDTVRFSSVGNAAGINSVATTLRVYLSDVADPSSTPTTTADTFLLNEISVPIVATSNSTNATNYYEVPINKAIPTGKYIHVSQHVAQTTNQNWQAIVFGGDY